MGVDVKPERRGVAKRNTQPEVVEFSEGGFR
jgi:hypothetical protein